MRHVLAQPEVLDLRIAEHFVERIERRGRHVRGLQLGEPRRANVSREDLGEFVVQNVIVAAARFLGGKTRIGDPLGPARDLRQRLPEFRRASTSV